MTAPPADLVRGQYADSCAQVAYLPCFIEREQAAEYMTSLQRECEWRRETLSIFGRRVETPRLTAWYGDAGTRYRYSGAVHEASGWTPELAALRDVLERALSWRSNFVLANRYRDGRDCMGWHADDEGELGAQPLIASLSFGATRRFRLRHRTDHCTARSLDLEHGSLLLMWGEVQREWQHCLPRAARVDDERINLTFRKVVACPA